ncbi:MAG TPA: Na+/H+ antiporter NhaC family protein, partial [Gammaproteobacteria bacterium]|nr:Na+/H+ antiporter NhaC family protein [Gammaproteobacteria bacterium]
MAETEIQVPEVALTGIPFDISIADASNANLCNYSIEINKLAYQPDDCMDSNSVNFSNIVIEEKGSYSISIVVDESEIATKEINVLWGWLSVLPPLFTILMALISKSVIPSLFLGIWIGSFSILGLNITVLGQSFLDIIARYIKNSLANPDHAAIIIFTLMIGGLVGIISKNGGMLGVVNSLTRFTTNAKRGQLITSFLGIAIFFDDYANTLVVGNTMRKITDKLKIS